MGKPRLLIADDEAELRECYRDILAAALDCAIDTAENGAQAFELFRQGAYDLVITDHRMPVLTGAGLITAIRKHGERSTTPVILITGFLDEATDALPKDAQVLALEKPVSGKKILAAVRAVLNLPGNGAA